MKLFVVGLASVLVVSLTGLAGCASQQTVRSEIVGVEMMVEGGLTGRGDGRLGIRDGELVATDAAGRVCTESFEAEQMASLAELMHTVGTDAWDRTYFAEGADFFTYTLVVETSDGMREISWNDGSELPDTFQKLVRSLWEIKLRALSDCAR